MTEKLIVFDLDGTLYNLDALMGKVFQNQVSFLMKHTGWSEGKAVRFLHENDIEPKVTKQSKSATELFATMGIPRGEWTVYREKHFPFSEINPQTAVSGTILGRFGKLGEIVLLTSNTTVICRQILSCIGIQEQIFSQVICSDSPTADISSGKSGELQKLVLNRKPKNCFSIGDRYQTDIVPMLGLGGCGILVKRPTSLERICQDFETGQLADCQEYCVFKVEE